MYPLNAIPIGCTSDLQAQLRRLLANQAVNIEGEYPSVSVTIDRLRGAHHEPRLFVFYADAAPEMSELRRLRGAYVGQPIITVLPEAADHGQVLNAMRWAPRRLCSGRCATRIFGLPWTASAFNSVLPASRAR